MFEKLKKVMPYDYNNSTIDINTKTLAKAKKSDSLELSKLMLNGYLTFDPSLKVLTKWTNYDNFW